MNETLRTVISGTCGGMASILAVHPLDTVRTRLQAAPAGAYRGAWHCARATLRREGPLALYKGLAWPLAAQGLYKAIMFGVYGAASRALRGGDPARPLARRPHEEGAAADHRVERRAADARRTHAARAVALCPENLDAAVAPQPDALRRRHGGVQLLPPRGRVEEHARARTGVAAIRQDVQRARANRAPRVESTADASEPASIGSPSFVPVP